MTSALTPLCAAVTCVLPVTTGTTHESIDPVNSCIAEELVTPVFTIVPVASIVHVFAVVHVITSVLPVSTAGVVAPFGVHPAKLAAIAINPTMYTFFIIFV